MRIIEYTGWGASLLSVLLIVLYGASLILVYVLLASLCAALVAALSRALEADNQARLNQEAFDMEAERYEKRARAAREQHNWY